MRKVFSHKHILQGLQNHIQVHATLVQLGIAKYSPIFVKFRCNVVEIK